MKATKADGSWILSDIFFASPSRAPNPEILRASIMRQIFLKSFSISPSIIFLIAFLFQFLFQFLLNRLEERFSRIWFLKKKPPNFDAPFWPTNCIIRLQFASLAYESHHLPTIWIVGMQSASSTFNFLKQHRKYSELRAYKSHHLSTICIVGLQIASSA